MRFFAVIDTNVLVSALLTRNTESATFKIVKHLFEGKIIPLYCREIVEEYYEVLSRKKFHFEKEAVLRVIKGITENGVGVIPEKSDEHFEDESDTVFYEVALTKQDADAHLVTGNIRHFPRKRFVVTPKEMLELIRLAETFVL